MFVSKTVPLSELDEKMLLPPKNKFKSTSKADLSTALRVVKQPYVLPKDDNHTVYKIELIYYVSNFSWGSSVDFYLTVNHFVPNVVRKIQALLH